MLYHLFYELLSAEISGLNVFRYLTFRSVGAALTSSAWSRLSSAHGPAMIANGLSLAISTLRTLTV